MQADKFIPEKTVCSLVGVSHATLWRWERDGNFPKRRKLGPRRVGWPESQVMSWLATRPEV